MHLYAVDLETRPLANCDPTNLHSRVLARGNYGLENVTCFKPAEALGSHSVPGWETILICPTHLAIAHSVAITLSGFTRSTFRTRGVEAPTQVASSQWVLGNFLIVRLNLILPPVPVSTGKPVASNLLNKAHR